MSITIDYSRMVPAVDPEKVKDYAGKIAAIDGTLKNKRAAGDLPFYDLPYRNTADIAGYAAEIRGRFKNLVVLGIGGSALAICTG
jgi:glucose-6-phosphate isomerase